jgi:hypothetical protein
MQGVVRGPGARALPELRRLGAAPRNGGEGAMRCRSSAGRCPARYGWGRRHTRAWLVGGAPEGRGQGGSARQ